MVSNSEPKHLVFTQKAKDGLPGYLKLVMQKFMVQKVWTVEGHPPLPDLDMAANKYQPDDRSSYLAYCQRMLDQGKVTEGIGRSMLVGLAGCGKKGQELSEVIKKKVLKR